MNCATHNDVAAVAFCRTCGKPLCNQCTRDVRGVIYCESCLAARMEGVAPAAGFVPSPAQTVYPPMGAASSAPRPPLNTGPNPAVAGILAGFFPFGVGAVYCSQYAKGLAHLLIFSLLIFGAGHAGNLDWLFGIGIAFFYVYQIIDAVRTAKAIQAGEPAPDPLGLAAMFGAGEKFEGSRVPAGAAVLIGLGILFLLHTMDFIQFGFEFFIGVLLLFLGGWTFAKHWGLLPRMSAVCRCDQCRMRNLMGPAVLMTVGIIFLLDSRDINGLSWGRTWPAILLVIGIVKLLQSNASSSGHVGPLPPVSSGYPPAAPPPGVQSAIPSSEPPSSGEVKNV